ncbi:DNA mismatch repair protein MutL [Colletotrichum graminicola]|uniref:DNA mismatch repair protein MutL n=1 Tax=Colletotrichum graminicola (strain M1.001 / M2 / FGSC 10212) TaxID=645133 RepID=E3QIH0_COLGM|nr:DNA mismatch repair protein MutL [Colletotrichum graminicola M1.001]EFQ30580.1 DNA mismatch repair protein MutL [Colletotrichum graminicola M1.001]WDK21289.1 DNA mismatch repair protein MutL [Colletotrichum graminicola]
MPDSMEVDPLPSAGMKRKAEEDPEELRASRRIRALDPNVVNKIAAGEIIVAPVNALKELIENSVDAGATALEVLVKEGGLKLLQITDNGCGIQKEDLEILCERHTTSKITAFEDLASIATYGFRGEALASISHIAHLSVTTKTRESECAWRATYLDGKLAPAKPGQSAEPKPTAGRQGTQISVEDMFYNIPTRRRAFRSPGEEFNKIIDIVGRYAIHCKGVAFSCKKHGESGASVSVQASATEVDRIRQIYGSGVANELMHFSTSEDRWGFKATGWATNANYSIKKTTFLLFINHRCVDSTSIKKALEQLYSSFLPKGGRPFIYLSLEIDPARVDVNVHPTKQEVHFLNEDEIIQSICEHIRSKLAEVDASRTFMTQSLLPGSHMMDVTSQDEGDGVPATPARETPGSKRPRRNSNSLVRTDTSLRKITSMLPSATSATPSKASPAAVTTTAAGTPDDNALSSSEHIRYEIVDRPFAPMRLTSVKELRAEVREDMHNDLTDIFATHTFVGIVDERRRLAAIQGGIKLYLIDYGRTCYEYCYQVGLTDFGNFGTIRFTPPLDLREILRMGAEIEKNNVESPDEEFDVDEVVEKVAAQLIERREMLSEYFSLEVSPAGELLTIPLLIKGYTPAMVKLPQFLLRLGPCVDWTGEKACFETFLKELASFYVPEQLPPTIGGDAGNGDEGAGDHDRQIAERRRNVRWALEHVFFPAFKARLVATTPLMKAAVLEVADLKGLYRVFERC